MKTHTGGLLSDIRAGKALMSGKKMVTFRGEYALMDGQEYHLRAKSIARIKKERTRRNLPWVQELG